MIASLHSTQVLVGEVLVHHVKHLLHSLVLPYILLKDGQAWLSLEYTASPLVDLYDGEGRLQEQPWPVCLVVHSVSTRYFAVHVFLRKLKRVCFVVARMQGASHRHRLCRMDMLHVVSHLTASFFNKLFLHVVPGFLSRLGKASTCVWVWCLC